MNILMVIGGTIIALAGALTDEKKPTTVKKQKATTMPEPEPEEVTDEQTTSEIDSSESGGDEPV